MKYLAEYFSEWEMLQGKFVDKIQTHILCSTFFENRAVDEIMWKNMAQPVRPQMTIRRMRNARWITKAIVAHSEYVRNT